MGLQALFIQLQALAQTQADQRLAGHIDLIGIIGVEPIPRSQVKTEVGARALVIQFAKQLLPGDAGNAPAGKVIVTTAILDKAVTVIAVGQIGAPVRVEPPVQAQLQAITA